MKEIGNLFSYKSFYLHALKFRKLNDSGTLFFSWDHSISIMKIRTISLYVHEISQLNMFAWNHSISVMKVNLYVQIQFKYKNNEVIKGEADASLALIHVDNVKDVIKVPKFHANMKYKPVNTNTHTHLGVIRLAWWLGWGS